MIQFQARNRHLVFALLTAASSLPAIVQGQEQPASIPSPQNKSIASPTSILTQRKSVETSISLGAAAQLTATRVTDPEQGFGSQSFNPSIVVLGSMRQSFRPWLGYTVNLGYTRTTEDSRGALSYYAPRFTIPSNVYEVSVTYLLQKQVTPKLTGFADFGGGVLTFLPIHRGATAANYVPNGNSFIVPSVLNRQLGVGEVGIDYHFNSRLALRAEYRGLVYKYPDFGTRVGRQFTVSSQPTLSLTYTFGGKREGARPLVH